MVKTDTKAMTLHSVSLVIPGCDLLLVNDVVIYDRVIVKPECNDEFLECRPIATPFDGMLSRALINTGDIATILLGLRYRRMC